MIKLPSLFFCALYLHAIAGATVIPVTDPTLRSGLSPYNWVCQEDSLHASVAGASLSISFTGTSQVALKVDTSPLKKFPAARYPILAWTVNGGPLKSQQLAVGDTSILLTSRVENPKIDLYIKGMSPFENRWTGDVPENSVRITGVEVDDKVVPVPIKMPQKIWLNIGDSIMSGDGAALAASQVRPSNNAWAAATEARASYGFLLARHFGYRESRIAHGGYNWAGGMAGVPALSKLIDQKTSTVSRLTDGLLTPPPNVVIVNLGENGVPKDSDVIGSLKHLRSRIGKEAKIILMLPASGKGSTEISRALSQYQSESKDQQSFLIDLGKIQFETADGQHPTAKGHQTIFEAARLACEKIPLAQ
jgi:lysophospholipase L1-like esterase